MKIELKVTNCITEIPLKLFLKKNGVSQTLWKSLKHNGTITINGTPINPSKTMVKNKDFIICSLNYAPSSIIPNKIPLDILYEDDYFLIVNKPHNQLVHPTTKEPSNTLGNAVLHYYQKNNLDFRFHPLHRLDRNTTGIVFIAKLPHIQHLLSQNNSLNLHRKYLAIIQGIITPTEGTIDLPLARANNSIIKREVSPLGKTAITKYKTIQISSDNKFSFIETELLTGRTHQIRAHFSHIGHPLVGDDFYGDETSLFHRQALHAYHIKFPHPITKKPLSIIAPLPNDIKLLLKKLNFNDFSFLSPEINTSALFRDIIEEKN